ncbi:MAG: hypothetical protein AAB608_00675 [Patescibacteria group bacterium]
MKSYLNILLAVLAVVVLGVVFTSFDNAPAPGGIACTEEAKLCPDGSAVGRTGPNCAFAPCPGTIAYTNSDYGFALALPQSWNDFTVVKGTREVRDIATGLVVGSAPTVAIRHPKWTEAVPRQDVPVDVYTLAQWEGIAAGKYSVGAAPMAPTELARSSRYVFALPARYNYAFPAGFEEVETILSEGALSVLR